MTDRPGVTLREHHGGSTLRVVSMPMHLVVDMGLGQDDPREGEASPSNQVGWLVRSFAEI